MAAGYLETVGNNHVENGDIASPSTSIEAIALVESVNYAAAAGHIRMVEKDNGTTDWEWRFLLEDGGGLRYQSSADGSSWTFTNSSTTHGRAGGEHLWCRVVHDLATGDVTFYTSTDPIETDPASVTWTQLGTVQSNGTSIFSGPAPLKVGGSTSGDSLDKTYVALVLIDGTTVASPDARDDDQGWSTPPATDDQANSWTLEGGATWVAPTGPAFPDAPQNLTATPVSATQIDLDWDDLDGADSYDIERDGVVIETAHALNSYSDTDLDPSTEYDYRVRGRTT